MNKKLFDHYIMSLPKGAKLLDAGCGNGFNSEYVHSIRPDIKIFGADIDNSLRKILPSYITFFNKSITNLKDFNNAYFDCIICFHVLEHLKNPDAAISEFNRILRGGGVVISEVPHPITVFSPIGFNFYNDPTHVRPYTKKNFGRLFNKFNIIFLSFDESSHYCLSGKKDFFRNLLFFLNLYKTVSFVIARK